LLKSVVSITLSLERFKVFDKVSYKFDLVRNWAGIGELITLPVAIISC